MRGVPAASAPPDGAAPSRRTTAALLASALVARLFFVFVGPFNARPDEVFQALEPAYRLLTGHGVVTWEWREGIRSWLLPGLIAPVMWLGARAGLGDPVLLVQSVFAVLSLAVVAAAIRFGAAFAGRTGALFCGLLTAFWPDTMLLGPHTLSEVQGGNLLAVATLLAAVAFRRRGAAPSRHAPFGIGLLLGLAAAVRFQLLPGIAVVLLASFRRRDRGTAGAMLLGGALPVAGQAVLDTLTLGTPLQSMWKNLAVNLGAHRADLFGTMSPVFYLSALVQYWGAAVLPVAFCFAAGARRAPLASVVALAVVLSHSLIAHKEFTFIAGAVPLILAVAAVGAASLLDATPGATWRGVPVARWGAASIVALCVATTFSGYKALRRDHANLPVLMRDARRLPGLCGLALAVGDENWWIWSGGESLLDRDVPFYLLRRPGDLASASAGFDALLADEATLGTVPSRYRLVLCLHDKCLLRRRGPCRPVGIDRAEDERGLGLPIPPGSLRDGTDGS